MLAGKTLLDYTNVFPLNNYKKNDKIIYKYFKDKYVKSRIQTEKIDETINDLLEEIKHNYLMSEKHKKTCKYLKFVEHQPILASTIFSSLSISAFASLVCVLVGVTSSVVGIDLRAITAGIKKL